MSARLRGQRISRPELIQESREVIKKAGVEDHSRALLLSRLGIEVLASSNPAFAQLRPRTLVRDSPQWKTAYAIVFQYLTEQRLTITISTASTEGVSPPAISAQSSSTADERLTDLIESAPPKRTIQKGVVSIPKQPSVEPLKQQSTVPPVVEKPEKTEEKVAQEAPKRKGQAQRKGGKAVKTSRRTSSTTPKKENRPDILFISSPGNTPQDIPSDSDLQSDFVIEEIRPRATKQ
jgi:hypothetical protein